MDYSKWDKIEVDDDEPARPRVTRLEGPATVTIGANAPPQPAPVRAAPTKLTDYNRWEEIARGMSDDEEDTDEEEDDDYEPGPEEEVVRPPDAALAGGRPDAAMAGGRPGLGAGAVVPAEMQAAPARALVQAAADNLGGRTDRYVWSQTKGEVRINFLVPAGTRSRDIRLKVEKTRIEIEIINSKYTLDGELAHPIEVDEDPADLDWEVLDPDSGASDCRWLRLTVTKHVPAGVVIWWDGIFSGDAKVDVSSFADRDSRGAAQMEANWKEAHELFRQRVASRQKISIDV
mmetsp:Transcript_165/g.422  ORF Transcript_165/g.422 Transcript_165/m.422 type:complete len:289 (-) Transcript_165:189-1055(-)|eukprot:CAMPEP_0179842384 /NCGR_PEP_ID=MMETSP0982-20121206/3094_1 /TAXON_ID=483367 /ORGANISM="non described non described, Strain CCMP 2436" /LENGTH=288 /DNA_ID=CAMNT_0021726645 /DNA_START=36 /DNA_END=902 /DNA_ORIENTATION=+